MYCPHWNHCQSTDSIHIILTDCRVDYTHSVEGGGPPVPLGVFQCFASWCALPLSLLLSVSQSQGKTPQHSANGECVEGAPSVLPVRHHLCSVEKNRVTSFQARPPPPCGVNCTWWELERNRGPTKKMWLQHASCTDSAKISLTFEINNYKSSLGT